MSPRMRNVAVRAFQHSHRFGQRASSQMVWSLSRSIVCLMSRYSGPVFALTLNQGGRRCEERMADGIWLLGGDESAEEVLSWLSGTKLMESPWTGATPKDVQGCV